MAELVVKMLRESAYGRQREQSRRPDSGWQSHMWDPSSETNWGQGQSSSSWQPTSASSWERPSWEQPASSWGRPASSWERPSSSWERSGSSWEWPSSTTRSSWGRSWWRERRGNNRRRGRQQEDDLPEEHRPLPEAERRPLPEDRRPLPEAERRLPERPEVREAPVVEPVPNPVPPGPVAGRPVPAAPAAEQVCLICHEAMIGRGSVRLPCAHGPFHRQCIGRATSIDTRCPIRRSIECPRDSTACWVPPRRARPALSSSRACWMA